MTLTLKTLLSVMCLVSALTSPVWAADDPGRVIAEKTVAGYTLTYSLLNLEERQAVMKGMEGMTMHGMSDSPDVTHHLVVRVTGAKGETLSGKIGFTITHPDGKDFKTLTMGMNGGYGADVMFKDKGVYTIRMKARIDGKTLNDEISYPAD